MRAFFKDSQYRQLRSSTICFCILSADRLMHGCKSNVLLAERTKFDDLKLSFSCPSSQKRICLSCGERKTWVLPCHWQMMTYVRQIIVRAWKIDFLASVQNFVVWHKSESEKVYLWSKLKKTVPF